MAAVKYLALVALAGCGSVKGFGGPVPPLVTFEVTPTGTLQRPPGDTGDVNLQLALVWGKEWLVEPMCLEGTPGSPLPIDSRDDPAKVGALLAAGCRDPFGFVPAQVAASEPTALGETTELQLVSPPGTDIMVGDLTARVAYGSFIVYDDKNGDGILNLARPNRDQGRGDMGGMGGNMLPTDVIDVVYGASLFAMTAPDQRVAFREGAFVQSAFYPRAGCGDPPPSFSILAASGFSRDAAFAATIAGTLPQEDPSSCAQGAPNTPVSFAVQDPTQLAMLELKCTEQATDSTVRYREPDNDPPDLTNRTTACVHYPSFGMPSDVIEFVVSGRTDDSCVGLTHYILKGCREGPDCGSPDWDDAPPSWWPC